jgi:hypothetical protein
MILASTKTDMEKLIDLLEKKRDLDSDDEKLIHAHIGVTVSDILHLLECETRDNVPICLYDIFNKDIEMTYAEEYKLEKCLYQFIEHDMLQKDKIST